MRFAERTVDFPALDIAGRHVIDTYLQVLAFDVFKRDLPDYTLKTAARYFGLASAQRTYIEGRDIARVWREAPERLMAYARDDVLETERLARHLSGSTFYLTQMLPMPYGQVARTGPAAKIEALFVREYLRHRQSLPQRAADIRVRQKFGAYHGGPVLPGKPVSQRFDRKPHGHIMSHAHEEHSQQECAVGRLQQQGHQGYATHPLPGYQQPAHTARSTSQPIRRLAHTAPNRSAMRSGVYSGNRLSTRPAAAVRAQFSMR
jgi:hypothetical protein